MKMLKNKLISLRLKFCKHYIRVKAKSRREEKQDMFELQSKAILKMLLVEKTPRESTKLFQHIVNEYLTKQETNLNQILIDKKILETLFTKTPFIEIKKPE